IVPGQSRRSGSNRRPTAYKAVHKGWLLTWGNVSMTGLSLADAVADWEIHLRAEGKSPRTIRIYTDAARRLPRVDCSPREIRRVMADLSARTSPAYVSMHYRAWQQWFRWLVDEQIISDNPLRHVRPPRVPEKPVPVLSDGDLRRLLSACSGTSFEDRRDTALVRLFVD